MASSSALMMLRTSAAGCGASTSGRRPSGAAGPARPLPLTLRARARRGPAPPSAFDWTAACIEAGVAVAAAAWILNRDSDGGGGTPQETQASHTPACATCAGAGRVPCPCTRWSDGDSGGCGTCGGTTAAPCPSCGGNGRARRILARVAVKGGGSGGGGPINLPPPR